jgi:uncharacterized protein (DUF362 family)
MNQKLSCCTRRGFIQFGAGIAAGAPWVFSTACGSSAGSGVQITTTPPRPDAKVSIVSCKSYDVATIAAALAQNFTLLGGVDSLVSGKIVTVKVNLTCDGSFRGQFGLPADQSYITNGNTAIALASALLFSGAAKVRFVDSSPFQLPMDQVLSMAGWDVTTLLALGNVEVENTRNLGTGTEYVKLSVPGGGNLFSYFELNHCYGDTDVFFSLAKLKQHLTAGITLSMKNVFGSTPNALYGSDSVTAGENATGWRGPLHGNGTADWTGIDPPGANTATPPTDAGSRIPRIVADINGARKVHVAIIDGITSMSGGEGPWATNAAPTSPGILIAGLNAVSTDAVGVAVMGYPNPLAARGTPPFSSSDNHLLLAQSAGVGTADLNQIQVSGLSIQQALYPYPQSLQRLRRLARHPADAPAV